MEYWTVILKILSNALKNVNDKCQLLGIYELNRLVYLDCGDAAVLFGVFTRFSANNYGCLPAFA